MESDKVTTDAVEVTGYPDLARQYRVSSVPKTVVGETLDFVGAQPEPVLLKHVRDAGAQGSGLILG
jgi:Thioredoxin domain